MSAKQQEILLYRLRELTHTAAEKYSALSIESQKSHPDWQRMEDLDSEACTASCDASDLISSYNKLTNKGGIKI